LFHWIFQASRSWPSISALLEKMNQHLAFLPHTDRNVRTGIELVDSEGHIIENYETIFCELFCVAAASLASQMNEDLVDAGVLWNEILTTGGTQGAGSISEGSESAVGNRHDPNDLAEKGVAQPRRNGQGHLMFLVRKVALTSTILPRLVTASLSRARFLTSSGPRCRSGPAISTKS
jgi:hypothetical protein